MNPANTAPGPSERSCRSPRGIESVPTRTGQAQLFVKETNTEPEDAAAEKCGGGGNRWRCLHASLCTRKVFHEALQTQDNPGHRVIGFVHLKAPESALLRGFPFV